jgi:hypothetical protein
VINPLTDAETVRALEIAGELIDAGIPVFCAAPDPWRPGEYYLPKQWERTVPSRTAWLERWRPGYALAMVGGVRESGGADMLDFDPRHGGDASHASLTSSGHMPRSFGTQSTPSGGTHELISPTGEHRAAGLLPGVDLQGGGTDGQGRGFAFISPTVRPSKDPETLGRLRPYRWVVEPDTGFLAEFRGPGGVCSDDSGEHIVALVRAARSGVGNDAARRVKGADPEDPFASPSMAGMAAAGVPIEARGFTFAQAQAHVRGPLMELAAAPLGMIEDRCNNAAVTLAHFVPAFWTADEGMALLRRQLGMTAYDESHPASRWTVEKFRAVLDGRRASLDPWVAEVRSGTEGYGAQVRGGTEHISDVPVVPAGDEVDALLAEMLSLDQVAKRPPPQPLIKELLNLDSAAWLIGAPGSRKSFVALDMAMHVAAGKPWQGLKTTQARVLIVAAEGAGGMGKRVRAYEKAHGGLPDGVYVLPRPVQSADGGKWAVLVEAARRLLGGPEGQAMPCLIVMDTQARVTVGLEENNATDMGFYIAAVEALRQATGACVLTVHHTGRKGGDARGSSAIDGAQDTELKVVKDEAASGGALRGQLLVEKQKDIDERPPMTLVFTRVVVGQDEDGEDITSLVLEPDAWKVAEGEAGRAEIQEEWETGHGPAQIQLFKVLRDQGGAIGLTKAESRVAMVERFYGGDAKRLSKSTYYTAWSVCRERVSADGDPVMVNVSGEKWIVDPAALKSLEPGKWISHK